MKFLLIFLIALSAFGQSKIPNDTVQIGNKGSGADKGLIFETNDGVLNKTLKVDGTTKALKFSGNDMQIGDGSSSNDKSLLLDTSSSSGFNWNGTSSILEILSTNTSIKSNGNVSIESQDIKIGEGSDADTVLEFDIGLGATNPKIKWDTAKGKFIQSIGGLDKDIGSGSGSGDGGINIVENSGFEDGLGSNLTFTAGRATELDLPNSLVGEKSVRFDPINQNEFIEFNLESLPIGLYGQSCQAEFGWKGGDENYTVELINGNGTVLDSLVLETANIFRKESFFFLCPSEADILGDSNLGLFKLKVYQHTLVDADAVDLDSFYIGSLKGLTETTLPDVLTAKIASDGTIISQSSNFLNGSCSKGGTGVYNCSFVSGLFTQLPTINCSAISGTSTNTVNCEPHAITTTSFTVDLDAVNASAFIAIDRSFDITVSKQGADAKQSVQVYKSIPKVSENVNEFVAYVDGAGTVTGENVDWINGNCTASGPSTCTFNAGVFDVPPVCIAQMDTGSGNDTALCRASSETSSQVLIKCESTAGTSNSARASKLTCFKSGSDYKLPTVQPVIVGQVANSYAESSSKNVRVESCEINKFNLGASLNDPKCNTWIDSVSSIGTGLSRITYSSGIFPEAPNCVCSTNFTGYGEICNLSGISNSQLEVRTSLSSGSAADRFYQIICIGVK